MNVENPNDYQDLSPRELLKILREAGKITQTEYDQKLRDPQKVNFMALISLYRSGNEKKKNSNN